MNITARLLRATVGSCTCCTKTPDIQYHHIRYTYRVLLEALTEIELLQLEVDVLKEVIVTLQPRVVT